MSTTILEVYERDELIARSAACTRRMVVRVQPAKAVVLRKLYEHGIPCSRPTSHRHMTGDQGSYAAKAMTAVRAVARAKDVDPWALIADLVTIVMQEQGILQKSDAELEAMLDALDELEHTAEAEENRQTARRHDTRKRNYAAAADANLLESQPQLHRAAILLTLDFRARGGRQVRSA